jgi:hypothetical protein
MATARNTSGVTLMTDILLKLGIATWRRREVLPDRPHVASYAGGRVLQHSDCGCVGRRELKERGSQRQEARKKERVHNARYKARNKICFF